MNLRAPSLIHNLTFDISCAGATDDGLAMAEWIKAALLPVMEEVFDRHDRPGHIRRIAQLEIDLGTVSQEDARGELARRLFAQLSGALESSLEDATAGSLVEEREQRLGAHLLDFLRTGRLDWSVAADGRVAHRQLLARVLESSEAAQVLRTAISDPQMLARLVRQFDAADLNNVAELLFRSWPEQERAAAATVPDAVAMGDKESYWRRLLRTSARPSAERQHREGVLQLQRMPERDTLREVWRQLLEEVRQRIGKRSMSALSPEAMTDLTLILRPRAAQLFAELDGKWEPSQIDTVLQLLLAGEGAIAAVNSMLAGPSEHIPAAPRQRLEAEAYHQAPPARPAEVVAGSTMAAPNTMLPLASDHAIATVRPMLASPNDQLPTPQTAAWHEQLDAETNHAISSPDPQKSLALLARLWTAFSSEQRSAFPPIWTRLSEEIADRTGGRDLATLTATRKSDLAIILQPLAAVLLKELAHQDETHLVEAVVQLLLAADDTSTAVQAIFASTSDRISATYRAAPRQPESAAQQQSGRAAQREQLDAEVSHRISSPEPRESLTLLARLWSSFSLERRSAFVNIWQRLSEEVADRAGGRDIATLTATQKSDLAMILQPQAAALLKELGHQDETHLVEAVVQLLLAADDTSTAVQAIFAGTSDRHHATESAAPRQSGNAAPRQSDNAAQRQPESAAQREQMDGEVNHRISSPDSQKGLALLARLLATFSVEQRSAFGTIWTRLSKEVVSRAAGRDVITLTETLTETQKSDSALILQPRAAALLKELRHPDETQLVEAVVQLLLAGDDTAAAARTMFTTASVQLPSAKTAARQEQLNAETNHAITSPDLQKNLATLARLWAAFSSEQRSAFALIWKHLSKEVADRAGGRDVATLAVTQKSDLALILQPQAATLLKEFEHPGETQLVEAVVQLLLAADDTTTVQAMFASTSDKLSATESAARRQPESAALRKQLAAKVDHRISSRAPQKSLTLLSRLWSSFSLEQRSAFKHIWERLSEEVIGRAAGRDVAAQSSAQRTDLAIILKPKAAALLKELGHQDETHVVEAIVQLLLAGEGTSIAVRAMFTSADAQTAAPQSATQTANQTSTQNAQQGAESNHRISSPDTQKSLAMLAHLWEAFSAEQRAAFDHIWQRLSEETASRVGGRDMATLETTQKADLAMILRPLAATLLKDLGHHDETRLADLVAQLLLSDDAPTAVQAMLASPGASPSPSGQPPASSMATRREQLDAEVERQTSPQDHQLSREFLTSVWLRLGPVQRTSFRHIWLRLIEEVASQTSGRDVATLSRSQKSNLAMILQPHTAALLKQLGDQEEAHFVDAVVQLLLVGGEAFAAVQSMISNPGDQLPVARRELLDTATPPKEFHHDGETKLVEPVVQALLAGDKAADPVKSMLHISSKQLPAALAVSVEQQLDSEADRNTSSQEIPISQTIVDRQAAIDPSLSAFRDWQQGKLDILTLAIVLPDLRQWLNWWLLHDPQQVNQDCSLMLEAINTQMQQVTDPVLFMKLVLVSLKAGDALDLDALSQQAEPEHGNEHEAPSAPIANAMPPTKALGATPTPQTIALSASPTLPPEALLSIAQQAAGLDGLNSAQLHHIVRAKIQQQGDGPSLFLDAIEAHALRAASIAAFFRQVLQHLIADQPVDLEQLLADTDSRTPPPATDDIDAPAHQEAPAPLAPAASALPEQLRLALPQRLANAMLQADLGSLEILWPEITRSHATELAVAAQRYLSRAELRARLIEQADTGMLKDLLMALSSSAAGLIETILRHSAQYSAMLPTRLSAHEFEQRVFRYAFEQALKPDISPIEWLHALMSSVQQMNPDQRRQLEHAWYEVLRAGKQPALLMDLLEQTLFAPSEHSGNAPEPAASLMLMRQAELDATDHASLASLLKNIGGETDGSLESALSDPQALARLTDISPSPVLARMFAVLKPTLAAQLPALLRQLQKTLSISLAPVPARLDRRVWRAIYQAAFADASSTGPDAFVLAMVTHLASQYRQADAAAWLEKTAGAKATTTATVTASTPDQALAQLLQPWAEPTPEPAARKPAPAKRSAEEPAPLIGESNIHNAGMVIIAPYIQRLFNLLELTVDGKFVSDDAAQRGVHLLQYVVTGEEATPEYQLVLNKLLCGIHGGVPIVAGISITDKEKTTIEQMLNGVITHWSALGSTSITGLRETFLQRQGHLYFQEDAWQLKIPTKTFDMLLDRLPWSFAMTKMPWMAQPMHVTWR